MYGNLREKLTCKIQYFQPTSIIVVILWICGGSASKKHAHLHPFFESDSIQLLHPVSASAIRKQHLQDVTVCRATSRVPSSVSTTASKCVTGQERTALWMRGHHAQDHLPKLISCADDLLKQAAFSYCAEQGYVARRRCCSCFLWHSWALIQQESTLLYHTGNCCLCDFSSTCLSLISLHLRQLLFSPVHPHFAQTLQYLGDETFVFDKQRNVPLCVAGAEQGLSGEGLPFRPNVFPELLSKSGESHGGSQIGATSIHLFLPKKLDSLRWPSCLQDQEEWLAWEQRLSFQ